MDLFGYILLGVIGLFISYVVIFYAVKHAIDDSEVGKLIKTKYGVKNEVVKFSDDEIETEIEDYWDKK